MGSEANTRHERIRQSLRTLDRRLAEVVRLLSLPVSGESQSQEAVLQGLAGVFVSEMEVQTLLSESLVDPPPTNIGLALSAFESWDDIAKPLELSNFDVGVLLLALCVEFDRKYERVFAYLNNDLTRKRPTIGLAMAVWACDGSPDIRWLSFSDAGPLRQFGLIEVIQDDGPRSNWSFRLTEGALLRLLGFTGILPELSAFVLSDVQAKAVSDCLPNASGCRDLIVTGLRGVGKSSEIAALATRCERTHISLDVSRIAGVPLESLKAFCRGLRRDVRLFPTLLHLRTSGASQLADLVGAAARSERPESHNPHPPESLHEIVWLLEDLRNRAVTVIETDVECEIAFDLACRQSRYQVIEIPLPDSISRKRKWAAKLNEFGVEEEGLAASLAQTFRLSHGQVEAAAWQALHADGGIQSYWRAASSIASSGLLGIAERITPRVEWNDLVLGPTESDQLHDLVRRVRYREVVISEWGFDQRLSYGTGVNALFAGPPGTGKTMAAEVLANELRVPLVRIDCAAVISKYIGETEKNLERIFVAAERCDVVLFFDEADALFGKRTQINDAHDRYANIETSYLLQRIERHHGIAVLATNLLSNIDSAFVRRLTQVVHFRAPDAESRERIWSQIWPTNLPLADDVVEQIPAIARQFDLNGGGIKNAALTAAFLAADSRVEGAVQIEHVLQAIAEEYRKLGRSCDKFDSRSAASSPLRRNGVSV